MSTRGYLIPQVGVGQLLRQVDEFGELREVVGRDRRRHAGDNRFRLGIELVEAADQILLRECRSATAGKVRLKDGIDQALGHENHRRWAKVGEDGWPNRA